MAETPDAICSFGNTVGEKPIRSQSGSYREMTETCKTRNQTKYIGKENADKLLEYAATVENTETDPRIVQLLLAER